MLLLLGKEKDWNELLRVVGPSKGIVVRVAPHGIFFFFFTFFSYLGLPLNIMEGHKQKPGAYENDSFSCKILHHYYKSTNPVESIGAAISPCICGSLVIYEQVHDHTYLNLLRYL